MNRRTWILLLVALALMGGSAALLGHLRLNQKLGAPGVKTHPLPDTQRLAVELPDQVLNYTSENIEVDKVTLDTLPKDTSFGARMYTGPDKFPILVNVVLMGTDRTSMHKPQLCLTGQGYRINQAQSEETRITVDKPVRYELPVVKLVADKEEKTDQGQPYAVKGVYVYWFVADSALSASVTGMERMWLMAKHLVTTGTLQRWAYVSCFCRCAPGQEDAAFQRLKLFIADAVPQFQLTPAAPSNAAVARGP